MRVVVSCVFIILIYSLILFLFDYLFSVTIPFYVYQLGMFFILGVFCCIYFLDQIPRDLEALEEHTPYPRFYYVIASFYLFPASMLFLSLTYIYFIGFFLLQWSFLIEITILTLLGVGFGLFFLLQMEFLRTRTSNKLTLFFLKYFYWFILPLSI